MARVWCWLEEEQKGVPEEVRERVVSELGRRFALRFPPDRIELTSIPVERSVGHLQGRQRVEQLLDEAEPGWRRYYRLNRLHWYWAPGVQEPRSTGG